MESEFFALTVAGDEIEWLSYFLQYLSLKELQGMISICCDNQAMSVVTANSLFDRKKRTVHLKHGYLHELICHRVILAIDVQSSENIADPLTKGLKKLVERTFAAMCLKSL